MGLQLLQDGMDRISSHHQSKAPSTTVSTEPEDNRKDAMTEALPEWRLLTEDIIVNTSVAVEVLNDLLNYDKIQRGRLTLELGIVPIWTLLDQTVTEFKLMALEKHVNLKLDFSKIMDGTDVESPVVPGAAKLLSAGVRSNVVVGDEMRISQVLRNLLSNGLKFTPENGMSFRFCYSRVFVFHVISTRLLVRQPHC
jgi:signal transduction histidine kinase